MNGTRVGGRNRVDVVTGDGEKNDACAIGVGRMKNRDPNAKRDYGEVEVGGFSDRKRHGEANGGQDVDAEPFECTYALRRVRFSSSSAASIASGSRPATSGRRSVKPVYITISTGPHGKKEAGDGLLTSSKYRAREKD